MKLVTMFALVASLSVCGANRESLAGTSSFDNEVSIDGGSRASATLVDRIARAIAIEPAAALAANRWEIELTPACLVRTSTFVGRGSIAGLSGDDAMSAVLGSGSASSSASPQAGTTSITIKIKIFGVTITITITFAT